MRANLKNLVLILSRLAPALASAAVAQGLPSPEQGRGVILQKGCGACHVIPGIDGADGVVGPPLTMMGRRIFIAGLLCNTPDNLAAWVRDPQRFLRGAMPPTGLSAGEADDVAAYLRTLQ